MAWLRYFLIAVSMLLLSFLGAPVWAAADTGQSTAQGLKAKEVSEKAQGSPTPEVVVTENPSVLYTSPSWWGIFLFLGKNQDVARFSIRSRTNPIQDVQITSTGLGGATFALERPNSASGCQPSPGSVSGQGGSSCPEGSGNESPCIRLSCLDKMGQRIRIHLPDSLAPNPGNSVTGKILILIPQQKQIEVSLKVERPASPWSTAVQWFLGILIPTLITAGIGYGVNKLATSSGARHDRQKQFAKYKDNNRDDLQEFFEFRYATLYHDYVDDRKFASELSRDLEDHGHLVAIPYDQRKGLLKALQRGRREEIQKRLIGPFPDWKEAIRHPKPQTPQSRGD